MDFFLFNNWHFSCLVISVWKFNARWEAQDWERTEQPAKGSDFSSSGSWTGAENKDAWARFNNSVTTG